MSTVVALIVHHHQGFLILQDRTDHALGLNSIKHTMKDFLRQLELRTRCEYHAFESLFIAHIFCSSL